VPGVTVTASNSQSRLQTQTLANGEVVFRDLPPGRYHLSISSADYFIEDDWRFPSEDQIVPANGCAAQYITVSHKSP
jgi:hypothetical protein